MEFKTKFNTWEFVSLINEGRIVEGMIERIDVSVAKREINRKRETSMKIRYIIDVPGTTYTRNEEDIFKTRKEATIKLIEQIGYEVSENDLKEIK